MLCEEDSRLFEIAKRAQVNRNTAILIIDNARAGEILSGSFVRVLLELPSRSEGYLIARICGTTTGDAYSGFSTDASQTTNVYLILELTPALAEINGLHYQLNSISNTSMSEREFREWLALIRGEPSIRPPTVTQLEDVAARIHPYGTSRHRGSSHILASNSSLMGVARPVSQPLPQQQQQQQQRALSARAQARQIRQNLAASSPSGLMLPLPQGGNRSPAASSDVPMTGTPVTAGSVAAAGPAPRSNAETGSNAGSQASPCAEGSSSNGGGNYNPNRYVRQGTMMSRDYNRNPREDGQASNAMSSNAPTTTMEIYQNPNRRQSGAERRSLLPSTAGNGPASAAAIPFMTHGATDHRMESEDEELERRLRQDIMNHLAQEYVLFPIDPKGYKLSRLRLLERDMIEYLQHVRDEIQGKQENCIVCLDHVPTVILLPCKHKVMCRLCAPSVSQCPVCRSQIAEMFEPEEI
jgi:hypothetical protein